MDKRPDPDNLIKVDTNFDCISIQNFQDDFYITVLPNTKFGKIKVCYLVAVKKLGNGQFEPIINNRNNLLASSYALNIEAIDDDIIVMKLHKYLRGYLNNLDGFIVFAVNGKGVSKPLYKFLNNVNSRVIETTPQQTVSSLKLDCQKIFDCILFKKYKSQETQELIKNLIKKIHENDQSNYFYIPKENIIQSGENNTVSFAIGSCQYPAGLFDNKLAYSSYSRLEKTIDGRKINFLILTGDQVYVDASAGLFDPATKSGRYDLPYKNLFKQESVRNVFKQTRIHLMLDDHEIANNWEPLKQPGDGINDNNDKLLNFYYTQGVQSYIKYQRPDLHFNKTSILKEFKTVSWGKNIINLYKNNRIKYSKEEIKSLAKNIQDATQENPGTKSENLWYDFCENNIPFFMLDTRTQRSYRSGNLIQQSCILGSQQFKALIEWLKRDPDKPKFIISPSVILPLDTIVSDCGLDSASVLRSDSWSGYPYSLTKLLSYIFDNKIKNIVFLAGDKHISAVSKINLYKQNEKSASPTELIIIHSIISSGLYAPFKFANAKAQDIAINDDFDFEFKQGKYHCLIEPVNSYTNDDIQITDGFAPGDGFATISVQKNKSDKWLLKYEFDREETESETNQTNTAEENKTKKSMINNNISGEFELS